MQPSDLNVSQLFESLREKLLWEWVAGKSFGVNHFSDEIVLQAKSSADLAGYLNFIHAHRIPVIGQREIACIENLCVSPLAALPLPLTYESITALKPPLIVIADGQTPSADFLALCEKASVSLFATQESAAYTVDVLRSFLAKSYAQRISMHGVFMNIFGMGVLLQGESGLGKSELGLELISRGHGLIADDIVDFAQIAQGVIEGSCPALLQDVLEVRGIGLLNIRTIFGETAMRRSMRLRLIVRLMPREVWEQEFDRLPIDVQEQYVLGVPIREITIPVQVGRNIAVLVEAAVRNTILQMQGIDTYKEFVERQHKAMQGGD